MKISYWISIILSSSIIALSIYYLFYIDLNETDTIISRGINWRFKEKESISRFVSTPIILYHNINGKGLYSIDLDILRSHFKLFKELKINVITLTELLKKLENPVPYHEKVIVITFDDGFLSMYSKLLPLCKEFKYPITLFVYSNNIYIRAKRNLTWKHLRELEKNGIEIECHSMSHIDLNVLSKENTLKSKKRLYEEIYLSKRIIELYMKKKVKHFAFPYGRYNLKTIKLCQYSNYTKVFSTDYGSNIITRDNYCLRRTHIKKTFSFQFIENLVK